MKAIQNGITTRRSMLVGTTALVAFASGLARTSTAQPVSASDRPRVTDPLTRDVVEAYIYLYPLVVFGVSYEVLTNVAASTWERLSAPLNQFMSVREDRPDNHGVILPSTDTLYTLSWVDVNNEPVVSRLPQFRMSRELTISAL